MSRGVARESGLRFSGDADSRLHKHLVGIKNELGQIRSRGSTHGARHHAILVLTGSWVSYLGKYQIKVCVDFRGGLDTDHM